MIEFYKLKIKELWNYIKTEDRLFQLAWGKRFDQIAERRIQDRRNAVEGIPFNALDFEQGLANLKRLAEK